MKNSITLNQVMNESHQLIRRKKIIMPAIVVAASVAKERMLQLIFNKINHGNKS